MVFHASHSDGPGLWADLSRIEEDSGEIPLPAADSIRLDEDRPPVIVLVAPEVVPGCVNLFVEEIERIPPASQLVLLGLLEALASQAAIAGLEGRLCGVFHLGGLDYELWGTETLRLSDLGGAHRVALWAILQAIAHFGVRYPDRAASTVRILPAD